MQRDAAPAGTPGRRAPLRPPRRAEAAGPARGRPCHRRAPPRRRPGAGRGRRSSFPAPAPHAPRRPERPRKANAALLDSPRPERPGRRSLPNPPRPLAPPGDGPPIPCPSRPVPRRYRRRAPAPLDPLVPPPRPPPRPSAPVRGIAHGRPIRTDSCLQAPKSPNNPPVWASKGPRGALRGDMDDSFIMVIYDHSGRRCKK